MYIIILHAICFCIGVTLCRCRTAYKGFAVAEAQRESYTEVRNDSWYALRHFIYCLSCTSMNDCVTCYLCMHRSDYMSLPDSLQRIFRCSITDERDKLRSGMAYGMLSKSDWIYKMHCSDSLSLLDSLQRVRRISSAMRELDLGEECLMVWY